MASLAGNGLPPTRTGTAASERGRLLRDAAFAAVLALLAAVVVAGGVAVYPHERDASRERAREAILPGNRVVADSAYALEHADKLDDLAKAGAVARAATGDLELLDTRGISDARLRSAAEDLLRAQLALLAELERLVDLNESTVGRWENHRRALRAAVRRIDRARPAIVKHGLARELNVWGPLLSWSLANADAVVAEASHRLDIWQSRVRQIRRARGQALAAVASYEASVRGYLATYDRLGVDLDGWIGKVETEGATLAKTYRFLASASAVGQSVRDGIASLDAPPGVSSAHTNLLATIDRSLAVIESASAGIPEGQRDSKRTWQPLGTESDAVVRESAAARSKWQAAVAREVKRIRSIRTPRRPDV